MAYAGLFGAALLAFANGGVLLATRHAPGTQACYTSLARRSR